MKKVTILMMVILSIQTVYLFAQDTKEISTEIQNQQSDKEKYFCKLHKDMSLDKQGKCSKCVMDNMTMSKKEQMKMEVMKIYPDPVYTNISSVKPGTSSKFAIDATKSKKEQMKMEVMKIYNSSDKVEVKSSKKATCAACAIYVNRSKKEQMKMEVMKISKCLVH